MKSEPNAINDGAEALDFETAAAALESAVARLESEGLPLEEAIAVYEQGVQLAERCNTLLSAAELRLSEIGGTEREEV
jgi:exodeoxyribonuclease VII small subunit